MTETTRPQRIAQVPRMDRIQSGSTAENLLHTPDCDTPVERGG